MRPVATMVVAGEMDMSNHSPPAADDSEYCERYADISDPLLAVVPNHDNEILAFSDVALTVPTAPGTARG